MSTLKPFIFGGIASLTAEVGEEEIILPLLLLGVVSVGTFPLDTTKTRLQVQGQRMDELCRSSRYRGMMHALMRISQEEGVRALYKGYVKCDPLQEVV